MRNVICLGPVDGYDIAIIKINETQMASDKSMKSLREATSSFRA